MHLVKVSFNDNNWKKPSGLECKCKSYFTGIYFEWQYGFGWEEWNFSRSRILDDGYQYGFFQAVHNNDGLRDKTYKDLVLFTSICTEGEDPKNYIIGYINELETLNYQASRVAREKLNQNGLLVQMENDVKDINGDIQVFNDNINTCINVRYKPENIKLFWGKVPAEILQINLNNFSFKEIYFVENNIEDRIVITIEAFATAYRNSKK